MLEIHGDAAFAGVESEEEASLARVERRSPAAADVAAIRGFEFVNRRAVTGQQQRAVWARERVREVEDPQSVEWLCQPCILPRNTAWARYNL